MDGSVLFLPPITQTLRKGNLRFDLEQRSSGVTKELDQFTVRGPTLALRNIADNRNRSTPRLACKAVYLFSRIVIGEAINSLGKSIAAFQTSRSAYVPLIGPPSCRWRISLSQKRFVRCDDCHEDSKGNHTQFHFGREYWLTSQHNPMIREPEARSLEPEGILTVPA